MITLSLLLEIYLEILARSQTFWLTLLHTKLRWTSKESLLSTVTPSNFIIFLLLIKLPLTLIVSLLSIATIILDLRLLALRQLSWKHSQIVSKIQIPTFFAYHIIFFTHILIRIIRVICYIRFRDTQKMITYVYSK